MNAVGSIQNCIPRHVWVCQVRPEGTPGWSRNPAKEVIMGNRGAALSAVGALLILMALIPFGCRNQTADDAEPESPVQKPAASRARCGEQPADRELGPGQVHTFEVNLASGQLFSAEIVSSGFPLAVTLRLSGHDLSTEWIVPEGVCTPVVYIGNR